MPAEPHGTSDTHIHDGRSFCELQNTAMHFKETTGAKKSFSKLAINLSTAGAQVKAILRI